MLPRLWILLVALMLLAAPAGTLSAEVVDAQGASALCDDPEITANGVVAATCSASRQIVVTPATGSVRPAPVLAGIFRPPRPASG